MNFPKNNTFETLAGNFSSYQVLTLNWTPAAIVSLINFVLGLLGNGTLLLLFFRNQSLRTPFNVYVIFLLCSNLFCIIGQYPLDIYGYTHFFVWSLGELVCTAYIYVGYCGIAVVYHAHILIAVNRLWAISLPISYRTYHSFRVALLICISTWVYLHVFFVPGWMQDALIYRLPVDLHGCTINESAQPVWYLLFALGTTMGSHLFIVLSFPAILIVQTVKRRRAPGKPENTISSRPDLSTSEEDRIRAPLDPAGKESTGHVIGKQAVTMRKSTAKRGQKSHGLAVLVLLTISVCIFWTPNSLYYFVQKANMVEMDVYFQIAASMFSCQPSMDPVIFTMALPALREALRNFFTVNSVAKRQRDDQRKRLRS